MRSSSCLRPAIMGTILSIAVVAVLVGARPASGQATPVLTLPGGDSAAYVDNGDTQEVRLVYPAVLASGVDARGVKVAFLSVTRDDAVDPASAAQNQLAVDFKFDGTSGPRIEVIMKPTAARISDGVYALRLRVSFEPVAPSAGAPTPAAAAADATGGAGARADLLTVKVVHPAATLAQIAPTVVEQVVTWPWQKKPTAATVHLSETSSKSGLAPIGIAPDEPLKKDGVSQPANVTTGSIPPLSPGSHQEVKVTIEGNPPLGTSTVRLRADAPQLNAPVSFTIELRRRLNLAYIGLLALLGVILGVTTRVWLAERVQAKQAELSAQQVLQELTRLQEGAPDWVYRQALARVALSLADMIDAYADVADVTNAVQRAKTALKDAQENLAARRKEGDDRRKVVDDQLRPTRKLPRSVGEEVQRRLRQLSGVRAELERENPSAAKTLLDEIENDVRAVLGARVRDWVRDQREVERGLTGGLVLPRSTQLAIAAVISKLHDALEAAATGEMTVGDMGARLGSVEQALTQLESIIASLNAVPALILAAISLRTGDPSKVKAACSNLQLTLGRFGDSDEKPATWTQVHTALTDTLTSAREFILDRVPDQSKRSVQDHLDAGEFEKAALAAAQAVPVPDAATQGDVIMSGRQPAAAALDTAILLGPNLQVEYGGMKVGAGATAALRPLGKAGLSESPVVKTRRELVTARVAQTLLLSLAATAVAYLLFASKWVGTVGDLAAVFLWGFAADITVNGVLTAARAAQPAATPPAPNPPAPPADDGAAAAAQSTNSSHGSERAPVGTPA